MNSPELSKLTLLYVEDDIDIQSEMVDILDLVFKKIYVASDGEAGLELFKSNKIDIVLTDIRMPKMNGLEMAQKIFDISPSQPIIILSAFSDSQYLIESIKLGITDYVNKPIEIKKLLQILNKVAKNIIIKKEYDETLNLLKQYKQVADQSSIVSKSDIKGNITFVNRAFVEISGFSEDELLGKPHKILRHPDMQSEVFKEMWQTILNKKRWNGIVKNVAKDGSFYVVDSTIIPILDSDANIIEFISIRHDITIQELQKEELEKNLKSNTKSLQEKIQFIYEYEKAIKHSTLFCRVRTDALITTTSEAFEKLLRFNSGELSDKRYFELFDDETFEFFKSTIEPMLYKHNEWHGILKHKTKDEKEIYLQSSFVPIVDVDENVTEYISFYVDLSENIKLNREILHTQKEVISTMGAIGERRSKETGDHVKRVAEYSEFLALKYGLSAKEASELKMASPMHDIGKIGIPDEVLNKPSKLNVDEFEVIKTHALLGYEMLSRSKQSLLKSASIVAYEHHEKYNGSGYPRGLKGEEIHIYGRITAIADVFDALGHDRVYKKAWELEDILELFKKERGNHFDPKLVDIFFENLDEILEIKSKFDNK